MANGIYQRGGQWYAQWKIDGKKTRLATGIPISGAGITPRMAEKNAQAVATAWKHLAKGEINLRQAMAAINAIPGLSSAAQARAIDTARGLASESGIRSMPTLKEYLDSHKGTAGASAEVSRKRSYSRFLAYMGESASIRLDRVTVPHCRGFIQKELKRVSRGTVKLYRDFLSAAFNRAVEDELLTRNPFHSINVSKEADAINPELGQDKTKRVPFTPSEIRLMVRTFPSPWNDMVLVSFCCGGQRLGDVACMRWADVDLEAGIWHLQTGKTGKNLEIPICRTLSARLQTLAQINKLMGFSPYVFPDMARRYQVTRGAISSEFTTLLKVSGIIGDTGRGHKKGDRKAVNSKSFHSLRHSTVSLIRSDKRFTPDIARAVVGHDSEALESKVYYTASMEKKREVADFLASLLQTA